MNSNPEMITVAEIAADIPYSTQIGPFGKALTPDDYTNTGVPLLRGVNTNHGRFFDDGFVFVSEKKANVLTKYICHSDEIILVHKGTIGEIGIIPQKTRFPRYLMGNSMLRVIVNGEKMLPHFLYYWMCSHAAQWYLKSRLSTVGVPQIHRPLDTLRKLPVPNFSKDHQEKIVQPLRSIDSLIEINEEISSITEQLISALYRSWFIDFDPVKAKAKGTLPYGMDEETAELFPDSFEDSELGPVPSGWEINRYSDCMDLKYGGALKAEERIDGEFPVLGSNGVVGKHNEYLVNGPGIVIGRKGNPGTVNWIDEDFFPIDTTFYVQTKDENIPLEFLYHSLKFASLPWFSADSAVPGINRNVIVQQKFIRPPIELIETFRTISETIFQQNLDTGSIVNSLESVRDVLLPRLMSGELEI